MACMVNGGGLPTYSRPFRHRVSKLNRTVAAPTAHRPYGPVRRLFAHVRPPSRRTPPPPWIVPVPESHRTTELVPFYIWIRWLSFTVSIQGTR